VRNAVIRINLDPCFSMSVICSVTSDTCSVLFLMDRSLLGILFLFVRDTCLCWFVTWGNVFCTMLGTLCVSCLRSASLTHVKKVCLHVLHTELVIMYKLFLSLVYIDLS
jgi:hypothetical protein